MSNTAKHTSKYSDAYLTSVLIAKEKEAKPQKLDIHHNPQLLIDKTFGGLIVKKVEKAFYVCQCICGKIKRFKYLELTGVLGQSGATHCGCLKTVSSHPLYHTWNGMKDRCLNPNNTNYKNYGGRGIKICDEWANSFLTFLKDMGDKPDHIYSIDRINNDGNYEPNNCRWATQKEQANNQRNTRILEHKGKKQSLQMWAEEYGIPASCLRSRLDRCKWSVEKALTTPNKHTS